MKRTRCLRSEPPIPYAHTHAHTGTLATLAHQRHQLVTSRDLIETNADCQLLYTCVVPHTLDRLQVSDIMHSYHAHKRCTHTKLTTNTTHICKLRIPRTYANYEYHATMLTTNTTHLYTNTTCTNIYTRHTTNTTHLCKLLIPHNYAHYEYHVYYSASHKTPCVRLSASLWRCWIVYVVWVVCIVACYCLGRSMTIVWGYLLSQYSYSSSSERQSTDNSHRVRESLYIYIYVWIYIYIYICIYIYMYIYISLSLSIFQDTMCEAICLSQ